MASKTASHPHAIIFSLLLLITATLLPTPAAAASAIPDLATFISSVENGNADNLTGVYVEGVFALPVVQQPASNPAYVSSIASTLTQFSLAAQYGNIGLLAHNYLSGQYFSQLSIGKQIILVYGDGHTEAFRVAGIYRYQATNPSSTNSNFIDLDTGQYLTNSQLFNKIYAGSRHVAFQTCITENGDLNWGRLFVVGERDAAPASSAHWNQ
jgi:hypothetical protein